MSCYEVERTDHVTPPQTTNVQARRDAMKLLFIAYVDENATGQDTVLIGEISDDFTIGKSLGLSPDVYPNLNTVKALRLMADAIEHAWLETEAEFGGTDKRDGVEARG